MSFKNKPITFNKNMLAPMENTSSVRKSAAIPKNLINKYPGIMSINNNPNVGLKYLISKIIMELKIAMKNKMNNILIFFLIILK